MSAVGDARIRVPDRIARGEAIIVNSIISHPMDTGFFRTADGKPIPAWFIKDVVVTYGGEEMARFEWTSGISRDPVVSFMLKADKEAPLTMVWTDSKGSTFTKTVRHRLRVRVDPHRVHRTPLPQPVVLFSAPLAVNTRLSRDSR